VDEHDAGRGIVAQAALKLGELSRAADEALEAGGRLAAAAADLQRAAADERTNFRHWLILARIQAERGRIRAGAADYAEARRLRPRALVFAWAPYFTIRPQCRNLSRSPTPGC
jgi:cytochrome c-type biogenesis protein CcmH/NrfG